MILHEIELYSKNPEKDKSIYQDILGLKLRVDNPGLSVYYPGHKGLDFVISIHNPEKKVSVSFLVKDVNVCYKSIKEKGIQVSEPCDSYLGLREIKVQDKEGFQIVIHSPTDKSPDWIKKMI
jgi:catechol 2,3-dioxygenase-like lactoylglutathione lyase family enzyme